MPNIYNLFKFLKDKKGKKIPLEVKLLYAPDDELTPDDLNIQGDLDLLGYPLTFLPDNLKVKGYIDASITPIKSLPDNLEVGGYLGLIKTSIKSLPDNLKVGGNLYLNDTLIKSLPNNLKVGRNLDLKNTPLSKQYTVDEIRKMIEDKGGFVRGDVYD